MTHAPTPSPRRRAAVGFTLIELLIAVAIVGVLVMVALPSYKDSVRKSRRAEALTAIAQVQQAQERWRANSSLYANNLSDPKPTGLGIPATTAPGAHYILALSGVTSTGFTVIATANGGQADDIHCKLMGTRIANGNVKNGSGPSGIDWNLLNPDPKRCWAR